MTFCVKSLIIAAGGDFKPGMNLKSYWWDLCDTLFRQADLEIQPRTLERAWREGLVSPRLQKALEKLAQQRNKKDDFELIREVKRWIDWLEKHDPWIPAADIKEARDLLSAMRRLANLRSRIAVLRSSVEVAQAADDEETRIGKDAAE